MAGSLRVTLRKSVVSTNPDARATVRALGLHRIGETVELPDNPAVRGQIRAVRYLLNVTEESQPAKAARQPRRPSAKPEPAAGEETKS
jgi:large subunit ribosomal protein L30